MRKPDVLQALAVLIDHRRVVVVDGGPDFARAQQLHHAFAARPILERERLPVDRRRLGPCSLVGLVDRSQLGMHGECRRGETEREDRQQGGGVSVIHLRRRLR